ncbi:MAG: hypothetical protein AB1750_19415, partial [Chloroflexota bacterium]
FYEVTTLDLLDFPAGGFSLPDLGRYDTNIQTASVFFASWDEKVRLSIYSYVSFDSLSALDIANNAAKNMKEDFDEIEIAAPAAQRLDKYNITVMDFHGLRYDEIAGGRLAVIEPPGSKLIYFFIIAYGDQRWEREGEKVYQAMLDGLVLFPIEIMDDCPVNSPGYGASPSTSIKIGGGLREGQQRIVNYLDALLGPNGELVAYKREGVQPYGSVNLEKYSISYGDVTQTLYFDIYVSTDLGVPGGMNCSAPLPERSPHQ